jgi:hypothetical protein
VQSTERQRLVAGAGRDDDEQQRDLCRARWRGHNEEVFPAVEHFGVLKSEVAPFMGIIRRLHRYNACSRIS